MKIQLSSAELRRINLPVRGQGAFSHFLGNCKSSSMEIFWRSRRLISNGFCGIRSSTVRAAFRNVRSRRLVGLGNPARSIPPS